MLDTGSGGRGVVYCVPHHKNMTNKDEPQIEDDCEPETNPILSRLYGWRWHIRAIIDGWRYGEDGNLTIKSGQSVTLTKDMHYRNLNIKSGGVLYSGGYRIFVYGTLDIETGAGIKLH